MNMVTPTCLYDYASCVFGLAFYSCPGCVYCESFDPQRPISASRTGVYDAK